MEYLPVTVDKSHLITIGERLYSESIELIRELVNNAYDADATEVDIRMTDEFIEIKDNGAGMDREGLKQYLNIGSPEKVVHTKSPIYQRDRIGQLGIGKFAGLSACECFDNHATSLRSKNLPVRCLPDAFLPCSVSEHTLRHPPHPGVPVAKWDIQDQSEPFPH